MLVRRSGARTGSGPKPKPVLPRPPGPGCADACRFRTADRLERTELMLMRRSRMPSPLTAPERELEECSRSSVGRKRSASAAAGVLVTTTGDMGGEPAFPAAAPAAGEADCACVRFSAPVCAPGDFALASRTRLGLEGTEAVVSSRTWLAGNQPSCSSSEVRLRPYHHPPSGCLWTWTSCPSVSASSSFLGGVGRVGREGGHRTAAGGGCGEKGGIERSTALLWEH